MKNLTVIILICFLSSGIYAETKRINTANFAKKNINNNFTADQTISGNIQIKNNTFFYIGDSETDTSWRITTLSENLLFEKRVSGNWVTKYTITE